MNAGRFLLVVTGGSRGFGRCVAEEFVRQAIPSNPVDLILISRSKTDLETASSAIDKLAKTTTNADGLVVRTEALDLGDLDHLEANLEDVFSRIDPGRYSRAVLVNNAGSLGHISFANELPSLAKFRSEMDFNVTSASWLASRFAAVFGSKKSDPTHETSSPGQSRAAGVNASDGGTASAADRDNPRDLSNNLVVNISSLAALQPFESWGGYSSGKAARDMFHRQVFLFLAMEQASIGGLKVLNYAPGCMNTDMAREIRSAEQLEEDLQSGKYIEPVVSAEKCVRLVLSGTFVTGSHVDYWDKEEQV
ncbi:unnamed protein product [Scytosiphon promiscuus]